MRKLFHGISQLLGSLPEGEHFKSGADMASVSVLKNAYLLVEDGLIAEMGEGAGPRADQVVDLKGAELMPGYVDSHSHAVFAAPRHEEFAMRLKGASYEEIAAAGGGILNSAAKMALIDEEQLYQQSESYVRNMMAHGTTCLEIKSGYGLSLESELKILRVARRLKESLPLTIRTTFLGAHAFPKEYKGREDDYVNLVIEEMLPRVLDEGLADHIDVFCDRGFFSVEQTARILESGARAPLPSKIHGNELGLTGGVQVACQYQSYSVDHLEHCGPEEIACLQNSEVVPVALPGTSYFLGLPYTPGRELILAGLPLAIASDFNPGSSPLLSMQSIVALACTQMKLMPEEAFWASTANAARALRLEEQLGSLSVGKRADFWVTQSRDAHLSIPYFMGVNHAQAVYIGGTRV
ncbi:MAG: imidazolonepropionase [Bacteroidia bacterium]